MKLSIKREQLLKPLSHVASVVERRQTLPILSNILFSVSDDEIKLTGTDLEVEVLAFMERGESENGEITLPARKMLDICRALPAGADIVLKVEGERAVMKSGRSRFTLLTMPAADFPNLETSDWDLEIELSQNNIKRLFEKTQFCMAQQDVRYYLNGLMLEFSGKLMRAVATDGHRMAISDLEMEKDSTVEKQIIVPRKGVVELVRSLEDNEDKITLQVSTNHIRARLPGMVFTTKLIDGRFPDYKKVIPEKQTKRININKEVFRDALSRAAILSNEKYRGIRFSIKPENMIISAHNPEQEEAQEEIAIEYIGEEMEIGFNSSYIIDAVDALDSECVEFALENSNSSGTLRKPGEDKTSYVVMPMRL
ncbi:MAG: DNA polymerase III subunit beta [Gammaproteobacteria bacterium]|nr:MAG: DNA polymerase III subunit beta [Gammaproteobacteria bacterium]